jgi:hypothetical protein
LNEPYCRVLAHDGVNTINRSLQTNETKPDRLMNVAFANRISVKKQSCFSPETLKAMNVRMSFPKFGAELFSRCALPFAFASTGLAQITINPEIGAFTGGGPGHTVAFRKATPGFGSINNVDDAIRLLGYSLPDANVSFETRPNGIRVVNWADFATNPRPQQNFGNDLYIHRLPGSAFGTNDQNNYAARFGGYIYIPQPGTWNFTVNSDEGFRLRMGTSDTVVLESAVPKLPSDITGAIDVPSPGFYRYDLVYFERTGGSEIEFFANGPGQPVNHLIGDLAGTLQVFQTLRPIDSSTLRIQFLSTSRLLLS